MLRSLHFAWTLALVGACLPAQAATAASSLQLSDLMHLLAQHRASRASFIERKYIALLDRPAESSGELTFTPPDHVEKRTLKPKPSLLVVDGDSLWLDRPDQRRVQLTLHEHPEVAAFVDSIRGTLAGDMASLQANYTLDLSGRLEEWQLVLEPRSPKLQTVVTRIRIEGTQSDITGIRVEQADGDQSEMRITRLPDQ